MIRLVSVLMLVACGGRAPAPGHPHRTSPQLATAAGRSEDQCTKLLGHTLDLAVAERPADQKPTADERTAIEAQLRKTWLASCKQMTAPGYDCVLAAQSLAAIDACGS